MGSTELSKLCWHYCRILYLPKELILSTNTVEVLQGNLKILEKKKKDIKKKVSGEKCFLSEACWVGVLASPPGVNILLLSLSSKRSKLLTSCFCQFCRNQRHNQVIGVTVILLMGEGGNKIICSVFLGTWTLKMSTFILEGGY